jgi:Na+-driven multidrug efflux pump
MVFSQALNGAGDTKTPTRLNFVCFWVFQIPMAYYLVKSTSLRETGALLVIPIAHAALTLMSWLAFRAGKWRSIKV